MPDRDSAYLVGGGGGAGGGGGGTVVGEEVGAGSGLAGCADGRGGVGGSATVGNTGSGAMGCSGGLGNGHTCSGASGSFGTGSPSDGVCRDFLRNVCKRGKRCRFRHPDFNEVPDLGAQKNEFVFCHDHQNKECVRTNCRFVHGSKEDEDYYKKTGELPLWLRWKVAAGLGLSLTDLPQNRSEAPICRDFLKGECQRGNKCKFRHVRKDHEHEASRFSAVGMMSVSSGVGGIVNSGSGGVACGGVSGLVGANGGSLIGMGNSNIGGCRDQGLYGGGGGGSMGSCLSLGVAGQRRYDRGPCSVYDSLFENGLFDPGALENPVDHATLQLKRRRLEGLRLADGTMGGHYDLGVQAAISTRPLEYRLLEEENTLLRKRVEELKKQVRLRICAA